MPQMTCFQHIDCEGLGSLERLLKPLNIQINTLKTYQGDKIPENLGDGLIVLGGPMGVYEESEFPWMTEEINAMKKALHQSLPLLGICLGSQMMAHAAGAQVYRGALPEVGWRPITLTTDGKADPLFDGFPETFNAFHWHGDTFTLPKGAKLLAGNDWYPHQIFKVGEKAYGFQCHLEITEEMAKDWARIYAKELTPQGGPTPPDHVLKNVHENSVKLESLAEKVFTRFAKL
jgi:GMP synthase (glutamine-hydrolysing)